jgi:hypothetical protein
LLFSRCQQEKAWAKPSPIAFLERVGGIALTERTGRFFLRKRRFLPHHLCLLPQGYTGCIGANTNSDTKLHTPQNKDESWHETAVHRVKLEVGELEIIFRFSFDFRFHSTFSR